LVDYPISCGSGDLTVEGMDQLRQLGASYHKYLIDDLNFLSPGYVNPSEIFIRSTGLDRSYRSAVSFIRGLYPPAMPDEFVTVTFSSPNKDVLRPSGSSCAEIEKLESDYLSQTFEKDRDLIKPFLSPLLDRLGIDDLDYDALTNVCDFILQMHCHEHVMSNVSAEAVAQCQQMGAKLIATPFKQNKGVGFSYGMREVFRVMNDAIAGVTNVKFSLFALHDRGLIALLVALGQEVATVPPQRAHVTFEVYSKEQRYYLRVAYNGAVLQIPELKGNLDGMYLLHDFHAHFGPILDHCHEMP
jgi:acid phosphatase